MVLEIDAASTFRVSFMNTEKAPVDWPVQQIAAQAGTTCRTLRHHHTIGLLTPSRTASNGYLHYNQAALVRLQRILLLRELGLGLPAIAAVLSAETSVPDALRRHVAWWGLDTTQKQAWKDSVASLNNDWITASTSGVTPDSPQAQELARRYVQWLALHTRHACHRTRRRCAKLRAGPGGNVRGGRALWRKLRPRWRCRPCPGRARHFCRAGAVTAHQPRPDATRKARGRWATSPAPVSQACWRSKSCWCP